MKPYFSILFSILSIALFILPPGPAHANDSALQTIAFGSCAGQNEPQPIWDAVLATEPDLWIWGGDNIYGDTEDMTLLARDWQKLMSLPGYQRLRDTGIPILGTWDDHDYGANDAGADYPMREASQQLFLDFLGVPEDSPRRDREGVFHAQVFGGPGQRIQVIVLDTRYHRSPLERYGKDSDGRLGPYRPVTDRDATILGAEQWQWLEQQLRKPAEIRLVVSSIQLVSAEHRYEKWSNFPRERRRFFDLVNSTGANGVILLSGDRHHAELSSASDDSAYPVFELTSSGLNKSRPWPADVQRPPEPNRYRHQGPFRGHHFGVVRVDWQQPDPEITLEIHDVYNKTPIRTQFRLSDISPDGMSDGQAPGALFFSEEQSDRSVVRRLDGLTTDWETSNLIEYDADNYYFRFALTEINSLYRGDKRVTLKVDFENAKNSALTDTVAITFNPPRDGDDRRWGPEIALASSYVAPSTEQIGLQVAPNHAARWFEAALSRSALEDLSSAVAGATSLRLTVTETDIAADEEALIASSTLALNDVPAPSEQARTGSIPPKSDSALRVVTYNLLWGSQLENPEPFGRLFKALNPDILLLQEWSRERITEKEVAQWFSRHVADDRTWQAAVGGTAGSWHGTLVATHHPMRNPLPRHTPLEAGGWSFPMRLSASLVETPIGKVVAASTHLKASGHYQSPEDARRLAEADALNRLLLGLRTGSGADHVVLGGDFNLNGTPTVLGRAVRMLDKDGSALTFAQPTILGNGQLMATFGRPYATSRLDYLAYPDSQLEVINAFVLDTRNLSDGELAAYALEAGDTLGSDHYPVVIDLAPAR